MHRFERISGTMTHATSWNRQATGEAPASCGAAAEVGPEPVDRRAPGRGGREFGLSLVAGVPAPGSSRAGEQAHAGTTAAVVHDAEAPTRDVVGPGRAPGRVSNGTLDRGPRDRVDRAQVRSAVSPRPRLEGADR